MFCVHCGKVDEGGGKFCRHCGQLAAGNTSGFRASHDASASYGAESSTNYVRSTQPESTHDSEGLKGIGGWLLFLVLTLIVFNPFLAFKEYVVWSTDPELMNAPVDMFNAAVGGAAVEAAFYFLTGMLLLAVRQRWVPMVAVAGIWAGVICALLFVSFNLTPEDFSVFMNANPVANLFKLLWLVAWSAYLFNSRRVSLTYNGARDAT